MQIHNKSGHIFRKDDVILLSAFRSAFQAAGDVRDAEVSAAPCMSLMGILRRNFCFCRCAWQQTSSPCRTQCSADHALHPSHSPGMTTQQDGELQAACKTMQPPEGSPAHGCCCCCCCCRAVRWQWQAASGLCAARRHAASCHAGPCQHHNARTGHAAAWPAGPVTRRRR